MQLIAMHSFVYKGRRLRAGDSFDVGDKLAHVLITIGRARMPDAEPEKPRRTYRRRDLQAQD